MTDPLRILLIQARAEGDPMIAHELGAFAARCEVPLNQFASFNVATTDIDEFDATGFDALMIGGSGAYSLVDGGFDWHGSFLEMMRRVLRIKIPTFASCFGFQGLVQALGGRLEHSESCSEIGTFPIHLTDAADGDPLFGDLPRVFDAQLGHNDSAVALSDELIHLARSERCEFQAIRVRNAPVVATQFHPELTRCDNLERFECYLQNYKKPEQDFAEAMAYAEEIHRPSPHSCGLLHSFVRDLRHRKSSARHNVVAAE